MSSAYPGSDLDAEQLGHALVLALDQDSPSFERHVPDLQLKILKIEEDVRKALQRTNVHKNTFQPINKLPPEILSNILKHRSCERDLVAATHVCRCWRASLVSSPALWTTLGINRNEDSHRVHTYLGRSKSVAHLDIDMDLECFTPEEALLELIIPHVRRVESLTVHGLFTDIQAVFSRMFCDSAPSHPLSLTRLQYSIWNCDGPIRVSTICIPSQLKEVSIDLRSASIIKDLAPNTVVSLKSLERLKFTGLLGVWVHPLLRLSRLGDLWVDSVSVKIVNFLPVDGHLLLSKVTNLSYISIEEGDSRRAVLSGGGITIQLQSGRWIDPANWLSYVSPAPFGQTQHLTYSGFNDELGALELPAAAFESLEILQFTKCTGQFVNAIHRLLYEGKTPCPSLREIRVDSRVALGSVAWFIKKRGQVGDRIRLIYCSDAGTLEEVHVA